MNTLNVIRNRIIENYDYDWRYPTNNDVLDIADRYTGEREEILLTMEKFNVCKVFVHTIQNNNWPYIAGDGFFRGRLIPLGVTSQVELRNFDGKSCSFSKMVGQMFNNSIQEALETKQRRKEQEWKEWQEKEQRKEQERILEQKKVVIPVPIEKTPLKNSTPIYVRSQKLIKNSIPQKNLKVEKIKMEREERQQKRWNEALERHKLVQTERKQIYKQWKKNEVERKASCFGFLFSAPEPFKKIGKDLYEINKHSPVTSAKYIQGDESWLQHGEIAIIRARFQA